LFLLKKIVNRITMITMRPFVIQAFVLALLMCAVSAFGFDSTSVECLGSHQVITSWEACKTANAAHEQVPVENSFSDDNWSYGCIIIDGKLYFNSKTDSAATIAKSTERQKALCILPITLTLSTTNRTYAARVSRDWTNAASQANGASLTTATSHVSPEHGYKMENVIDGRYIFSMHHAARTSLYGAYADPATFTVTLPASVSLVAFGAAAAWPMHVPSSMMLTIADSRYTATWPSTAVGYALWNLGPITTNTVQIEVFKTSSPRPDPPPSCEALA